MPLRIGIYLAGTEHTARIARDHPARVGRLLRAEERGGDLDDAALIAAKIAVLKAAGGLSIFRATSFAITKVRGGDAALPRASRFENRLVSVGASWVAVSCGFAHDNVWSLAVTMPGDVPNFDAAVVLRTVGQALVEDERLDRASLEQIGRSANPELSRAKWHAATRAAEMLLSLHLPRVGISMVDDEAATFTSPSLLSELPVSIAHRGNYVVGAVVKEANQRRLRIDQGSAVETGEIN